MTRRAVVCEHAGSALILTRVGLGADPIAIYDRDEAAGTFGAVLAQRITVDKAYASARPIGEDPRAFLAARDGRARVGIRGTDPQAHAPETEESCFAVVEPSIARVPIRAGVELALAPGRDAASFYWGLGVGRQYDLATLLAGVATGLCNRVAVGAWHSTHPAGATSATRATAALGRFDDSRTTRE
jgi:hypothetical protein